MNMTMKLTQMKRREDKRHAAMSAALAIADLDPHAREDLVIYLKALNESQAAGDRDEQEYLLKAILEVFEVPDGESAPDIGRWAGASAAGRRAAKELADETDRFFTAYHRLKSQSGLTTIRQVAAAAKLSPTTVHAIENQRVKPQCRTLESLAKAFQVSVLELRG